MKTFKAFGPTIGKSKLSKKIIDILNKHIDTSHISKKDDYSSKLASQIQNEIKIPKSIINKSLSKELIKNIKIYLNKSDVKKIKEIKIINLWVVRQLKNEYNPIHYHEGQLSGVGYLKIPKDMNQNKLVKNKKFKTNGTIDFINGQTNFLSKSMKTFRAFGPTIGKTKLSKKIITILNNHIDKSQLSKKNDYSPKLASQIKNEIKIPKTLINKSLSKELIKNIKVYLDKSGVKKIKEIKIINLWVVRQLKNEYNPIHYHEGQLSGVGYLKIPKDMNQNKLVKNKKIKTNGTIDFINGQKNFLSKSIYNLNPKLGDLLIFPNYLMHTAYPFNVDGERRSFLI